MFLHVPVESYHYSSSYTSSYPFSLPCLHKSKPTISPATQTKGNARAFFPGLFTAVSCSLAPFSLPFLIVPLPLPSHHHHHVRRNLNSAEDELLQGCQMAKFDPFLSLDCAGVEGVGVQSKERKGSNFAA